MRFEDSNVKMWAKRRILRKPGFSICFAKQSFGTSKALSLQPKHLRILITFFLMIFLVLFWIDKGFAESYKLTKVIGERGSGPGQFNEPFDIAIDREGFLYVTDTRNFRIQKLDRDGRFVLEWGNQGEGDGFFEKPAGIAVDGEGYVYVSDYDNDYIQKFSSEGEFILKWGKGGKGEGEFDSPSGIAVDSENNLYVMDLYNHRLQKFDRDGNFLATWGKQQKVNNVKAVLFPLFPKEAPGGFYYPAKVAVGLDDRVYVSDSYNNRIQVFTKDGEYITQWGGMGFWGGRFRVASGIEIDREGYVYVADFYNDRVQKFTKDGRLVTKWGSEGNSPGQLKGPTGIAVDNEGNIYIADWGNHRIQRFKTTR